MMPAFLLAASRLQGTIENYGQSTTALVEWHSGADSFNVESGPAEPARPLAWLRVRCDLPHRAGGVFVVDFQR